MTVVKPEATGTLPVTVVVPVKNDARNLGLCLPLLQRFAAVVVIDSRSTDDTASVAEKHGATVLQFDWNGQYPKKRNWLLLAHPPATPWVLFLDADEYLNETFCDELAAVLPHTDKNGFWLNYTNYFLGARLRHGIRQRKLALLRVGAGLYEQIEEERWSSLDMEIHEHPIVDGATGNIKTLVDHRDYKGLAHFIEKHKEYALWEARRYQALKNSADNPNELTQRQRFKYRHLEKWWYPWFYLFFSLFVKSGIADGLAGFQFAFYKAWYFNTIRLLIRGNETGKF